MSREKVLTIYVYITLYIILTVQMALQINCYLCAMMPLHRWCGVTPSIEFHQFQLHMMDRKWQCSISAHISFQEDTLHVVSSQWMLQSMETRLMVPWHCMYYKCIVIHKISEHKLNYICICSCFFIICMVLLNNLFGNDIHYSNIFLCLMRQSAETVSVSDSV